MLSLRTDENNYGQAATQPFPTDSLDSCSRIGQAVEYENKQPEMTVWWGHEWSFGEIKAAEHFKGGRLGEWLVVAKVVSRLDRKDKICPLDLEQEESLVTLKSSFSAAQQKKLQWSGLIFDLKMK